MTMNKTSIAAMVIMAMVLGLIAFTQNITPVKAAVMVMVMVFTLIVIIITNYERFKKD